MVDYHRYSMEFELDKKYFMPFLQFWCFSFGWINIVVGFVLLWLLFYHSPMYSKEFRNAIAAYHLNTLIFDIHHSYLFLPYTLVPMPIFVCHGFLCRWKAPMRLLMAFSGFLTACGSLTFLTIIFIRLRNILPIESRFRLSKFQSVVFMGTLGFFIMLNSVGYILYASDDPRKPEILNRTEFLWLQSKPGALVWGDMFDTPAFDKEVYYFTACIIFGVLLFNVLLIYSWAVLRIEKKKLLSITKKKLTSDQSSRIFQIQLIGMTIFFILPLGYLIVSIKLGSPTSSPTVHSLLRFINIFTFLNSSIVATTLHLVMNRTYKAILIMKFRKVFNLFKPVVGQEVSSMFTTRATL